MKHVGNLQYITFLKGLAILGVILVHAPQLIKEINPLIREFLHAGAFGCQLFFVISGFLAVKSWERLLAKYENSTEKNRTTYKTFLKKRYLSIAPIYILFILFYQIISYYIATFNVEPFYKISHNPLSILANIFLLNGLDYQAFNNIVPGGWFIGTIFLFYLLFPLIYKLYRYIKTYNPRLLFLLPLGGVIVSAIFQTGIFFIIGDWTLSKPGSFTYYSIINQLPCMLIGVTLNYYLKNTKLSKNNLLLCFICLGLIGNLLWYALRLHYWIYALIPSIIGWSFFYLFLYVQRKSEEIRGGEIRWYAKRYRHILLPYLLICFPYYLVLGCVNDGHFSISIFLYRLSTLNYWLEHKGFWYIAMLIPLYFLTPFYARIIDKTKYQTLLTVTLCIILLLISTIKIENNNLFSHVWNNTAFVLQRIPSYLIGYYMAPSILKGKKVNLLKLTGIIAGCFLVIKIIFPANTFWEWLEIYPIMLVSYFFIKKSVWIKRICTFMGQISLESYLTNGCMILLIGLLPWETTLDHLNYGNYLRYTLIIVTGITTAYCANRIINKITARL